MEMNNWLLLVFGSGGLVTIIGYLLKNKQTNRSSALEEIRELDDRLKAEIKRLDKRVDEAEAEAKMWKDKAETLEDENEKLIEENNWYQNRVEELEDRVGDLEEKVKKGSKE
jgi:predicted nuclease with TOPRIM domain